MNVGVIFKTAPTTGVVFSWLTFPLPSLFLKVSRDSLVAKPEVPVDGFDHWVWVEQKREWIYMDENYVPPTQENNP